MEKGIKYLITVLFTATISLVYEYGIEYITIIISFMDDKFSDYPFVSGVFFSCLFALLSILLILKLANIDNKVNYYVIFRDYEKKLLILTMLILFYLAIHLASIAFHKSGIPFFADPYDRSDFFGYLSPQDVFLALLAISVVILTFYIAPKISKKKSICIPLPKLNLENKPYLLCLSCVEKHINLPTILFVFFLILSVIISFKIIPIIPSFPEIQIKQAKPDELMFNLIFLISFVILILFTYILYVTKLEIIKQIKDDFRNLIFFYCIIPAIILASLVLAGNNLIKYPNFFGNLVVGIIFIS